MIKFIEKEKQYCDRPFIGGCYYYPTYMIKDGKEYFVFNRREPDDKWILEENEERKNQLIQTDGKYFRFYSLYKNPIEMLKNIVEKKHHFTKQRKVFYESIEERGYIDFEGNLEEVSAAFKYRIYDEKFATQIQNVVECVNGQKWEEAMIILNEFAQ